MTPTQILTDKEAAFAAAADAADAIRDENPQKPFYDERRRVAFAKRKVCRLERDAALVAVELDKAREAHAAALNAGMQAQYAAQA